MNHLRFILIRKVSDENNSQAIKFNLKNQKGKAFSSKDLKGHLSLIYFGVTYSLDDENALKKIEDIIKILQKENIGTLI